MIFLLFLELFARLNRIGQLIHLLLQRIDILDKKPYSSPQNKVRKKRYFDLILHTFALIRVDDKRLFRHYSLNKKAEVKRLPQPWILSYLFSINAIACFKTLSPFIMP